MKLVLKDKTEIPIINAFEQIWRNMKNDTPDIGFDRLVNVTAKTSSTVEELYAVLTDDAVSSFSIVSDDLLSYPTYEGYILRGITKSYEADGTLRTRIEFIKETE